MSNLDHIEKRRLEDLLGMGSGYVLDFTNRSFEEFFQDLDIDISQSEYEINGTSKANRLRAFWKKEENTLVGKVLTSLFDYIDGVIKPQKEEECVKEVHRKIAKRLLGNNVIPQNAEPEFLDHNFGDLDITPLELDIGLENVINQRLNEIEACMKSKAWLSVIFLTGSTLEGLLLDKATKNPVIFNKAKSAPKKEGRVKNFPDWSLKDLIDVSHELKFIGIDVKKHGHALRDFRNYIHPRQQVVEDFKPDEHTAEIAWQVLCACCVGLAGKR